MRVRFGFIALLLLLLELPFPLALATAVAALALSGDPFADSADEVRGESLRARKRVSRKVVVQLLGRPSVFGAGCVGGGGDVGIGSRGAAVG